MLYTARMHARIFPNIPEYSRTFPDMEASSKKPYPTRKNISGCMRICKSMPKHAHACPCMEAGRKSLVPQGKIRAVNAGGPILSAKKSSIYILYIILSWYISLREGYLKGLQKEIYILGFSKPEIIKGVPELREGIGVDGGRIASLAR